MLKIRRSTGFGVMPGYLLPGIILQVGSSDAESCPLAEEATPEELDLLSVTE